MQSEDTSVAYGDKTPPPTRAPNSTGAPSQNPREISLEVPEHSVAMNLDDPWVIPTSPVPAPDRENSVLELENSVGNLRLLAKRSVQHILDAGSQQHDPFAFPVRLFVKACIRLRNSYSLKPQLQILTLWLSTPRYIEAPRRPIIISSTACRRDAGIGIAINRY